MSSRPRVRLPLAMLVACLAIPVGVARANELSSVAASYSAHGGTIPPCSFSSAVLKAALGEIGTDTAQYGADLVNAIQNALNAQASGACDKKHPVAAPGGASSTPGGTAAGLPPLPPSPAHPGGSVGGLTQPGALAPPPAPPALAAPGPQVSVPLHPLFSPTGAGIPAVLAILGAAVVLLILAGALVALAWLRGWSPDWAARTRHSFSEAGFRASGAWSDFSDWLRLGA